MRVWDRSILTVESAAQRAEVGDEDAIVTRNDAEDHRLVTEVVKEVSGELS
jgi:hypothetical protein